MTGWPIGWVGTTGGHSLSSGATDPRFKVDTEAIVSGTITW